MTHTDHIAALWLDPAFAGVAPHKRAATIRAHVKALALDSFDGSVRLGSESSEARTVRAREHATPDRDTALRGQSARAVARDAVAIAVDPDRHALVRKAAIATASDALDASDRCDATIKRNPTRADRPFHHSAMVAPMVTLDQRTAVKWSARAIEIAAETSSDVIIARGRLASAETHAARMLATVKAGHVVRDGQIVKLDGAERASLTAEASEILAAARLSLACAEREARLTAMGAPLATIREESRRVTGGDKRRGNVRADGSVILPGDSDYQIEATRKALIGRANVEPGGVRAPDLCGPIKVRGGGTSAIGAEIQGQAPSAPDAGIERLSNARHRAVSDLTAALRDRARSTGAQRKAATSLVRAIMRAWSDDPMIEAAALAGGWKA